MPITVRPATSGDMPTLQRFEQGVISAERPMDPTIQEGPIRYYDLDFMLNAPHIHLVIAQSEDGTPIGSGYARIDPSRHYLKHTHHAYLGFMYVEPAWRGKGVNQAVIAALRDWARERQIIELRLDVYTVNDTAIRAYEKAGFSPYLINMRMGI